MTGQSWQDRIVGDRMAVDKEFAQRVEASEFSRQQWSLVMTAVTFEIEDPADEDAARLVADTGKLPDVLPELDNVDAGMPGMGGGGQQHSGSGGSIVGGIKSALGLGGGDGGDGADADRLEEAEQLAGEYATALQQRLETQGKWGEVRAAAAGEGGDGTGDDSGGDATPGESDADGAQ